MLMMDPDSWCTPDNPPSVNRGACISCVLVLSPRLCWVMSTESGSPHCRCTQTTTSAQHTIGSVPTCCHRSPLPPSHGPSLRGHLMGHTPSGIMVTTSTLLQASRASRANQVSHVWAEQLQGQSNFKGNAAVHLAAPGPISHLSACALHVLTKVGCQHDFDSAGTFTVGAPSQQQCWLATRLRTLWSLMTSPTWANY